MVSLSENNDYKRVSSVDVAKAAGVSQSTVSRVFSDKSRLISLETKEKVQRVAQEMGYRPSVIARSLSTNSTKIIGIEMSDFSNAYYMKALGLFSQSFQAEGYHLMIFGSDASMKDKLKIALEYQVAGLILTNATLSSDEMDWIDKYHIPVFMFNRISGEDHPFNWVVCDNYAGGYAMGQALISRGYQRLAYIAGDEDAYTNLEREKGFMKAVSETGVSSIKIEGSFDYRSGYRAGSIVGGQYPELDGVFCASDSIALGFIDGLKATTKLRIPEDIGLVGFDGIDEGGNVHYQLTTYKQPLEAIVDRVILAMIHMIESGSYQQVQEKIPGDILYRRTLPALKKDE